MNLPRVHRLLNSSHPDRSPATARVPGVAIRNRSRHVLAALCGVCLALLSSAAAASSAAAVPKPSKLIFEDPKGDDYGPGSYSYPQDPIFVPGVFDLVRVTFEDSPRGIIASIEFNVPVPSPTDMMVDDEDRINDLCRLGFYLQTVDLYFFTGGQDGENELLPGRRAKLAEGMVWNQAVVMQPQPQRFLTALESLWVKKTLASQKNNPKHKKELAAAARSWLKSHVFIAASVQVNGPVMRTTIPSKYVGSVQAIKGVLAIVTGAGFEQSYDLRKRLSDEAVDLMMVRKVNEHGDRWNFGGGASDDACPIIDLICSPSERQSQLLNPENATGGPADSDAIDSHAAANTNLPIPKAGAIVALPLIMTDGSLVQAAAAPPQSPPLPATTGPTASPTILKVLSRHEDWLSTELSGSGRPKIGDLVQLLDDAKHPLGTGVIAKVLPVEGLVIVKIVECQSALTLVTAIELP